MSPNDKFKTASTLKVGLLYFSGAGNTECIARIFEKIFGNRSDCEVVFCKRITKHLDPLSLGDFDLLGLGFPIYFRRTPEIVYDTAERLPGKGRRIFTFCTKGMYSGNVSRDVQEHCRRAGFSPAGNFEARMPGTDVLLLYAKKGSRTERLVKKMGSREIVAKARRFVRTVLKNPGVTVPSPKWYTFIDEKGMKPLERLFTKDYQIFRGKYHVLEDQCTKCLLCVRDCPEGNITFQDESIVFGDRCDICLRCIHHCPTEAIQLGNKTLNTVRYWPRVTEDLSIVDRNGST
jgi:ferredoxin/flavodoxin